jgi:large conductance mechanosensitive channel
VFRFYSKKIARTVESILGICFKEVHLKYCLNILNINLIHRFMGMLKEFKEFAVKGNVIDLAVGVIIGVAFGKIVSSLVNDIIMSPIGLVLGGKDFDRLRVILKEEIIIEAGDTIAAVSLNRGAFIQNVIDFIVVAIVIFIAIRTVNRVNRKEEAKLTPLPATPPKEEMLLTEITDLIKMNKGF